ncbi:hypothetical protein BX600DRAFT_443572 [Xylariales sp. PMI_506]|nr:hypothetical protein BX600DRAFT_443572 [Xylariales sp. PMI_506]
MLSNLFVALPLVLGALASPVQPRTTSDFTLYAYGAEGSDNMGGYPVVFKDGLAYISDLSTSVVTKNVTFDVASRSLTATTQDSESSLLYIPSTSGAIGFTTSTGNSSQITTGFGFYGHSAFCVIDGAVTTKWYAVPTEDSGLWELGWNIDNDDAIVIALRNIAPS